MAKELFRLAKGRRALPTAYPKPMRFRFNQSRDQANAFNFV
jgi:hypothetical protein